MSYSNYILSTGIVAYLEEACAFPPLSDALSEPNGLLAIGASLSKDRLLEAYRRGIFPWFSEDEPVLWWSPNPRMVLFTDEVKITKSLDKTIKKQVFDIKFNSAFREVITACSQAPRKGQNGTWITTSIIDAYCELHSAGYAISAEAWQNEVLVGGCYGVKIGNMFYGESMFHHVTDASKVAFASLVRKLKLEGVKLIDCQMKTEHLANFGAREVSRELFIKHLTTLVNQD
jgi:leucyl/phenylalanyl-tRNA--protein transferase